MGTYEIDAGGYLTDYEGGYSWDPDETIATVQGSYNDALAVAWEAAKRWARSWNDTHIRATVDADQDGGHVLTREGVPLQSFIVREVRE